MATSQIDRARGITVDALGNSYITGVTTGRLGDDSFGGGDAFLTKIDPAGNPLWTRQVGSLALEAGNGVAVDEAGNIFFTGTATGSFASAPNGSNDVFLTKLGPAGNTLWNRQIGSSNADVAYGVALGPAGNPYVTGSTGGLLGHQHFGLSDAFVSFFTSGGSYLGTAQMGTGTFERARGIAADSAGNVYISGSTAGRMNLSRPGGTTEAFVSKLNASGLVQWTCQVGTPDALGSLSAYALALDEAGNTYITGRMGGDLAGTSLGGTDVFLSKIDNEGNLVYSRQWGTPGEDDGRGVALDSEGNIFVAGFSTGDLGGENAGLNDVFLTKFDAQGNHLWDKQLGTVSDDIAYAIAIDSAGHVYLTGTTEGDLVGPHAGSGPDAFVIKLVPEPGSLALLSIGAAALIRRRRY